MEQVNSSKEMPVCALADMEKLVGQVLTLIEATSNNSGPQLHATLSLAKQTLWGWYDKLPGYTTILGEQDTVAPTI